MTRYEPAHAPRRRLRRPATVAYRPQHAAPTPATRPARRAATAAARTFLAVIVAVAVIAGIWAMPQPGGTASAGDRTGYTDVGDDSWIADAVVWGRARQVGWVDGPRFYPRDPLAADSAVRWVWRAFGRPADTSADDATDALNWARRQRVIRDGEEHPLDQPVNRLDFAAWIWRASGEPWGPDTRLPDVPYGYRTVVRWLQDRGVVTGVDEFRPYAPLTRGNAIGWLWRLRSGTTPPPPPQQPRPTTTTTPPQVGGRRLVWADEFNGTRLDPTRWLAYTGYYGSTEGTVAHYTDRSANVRVGGGYLRLEARRESYAGRPYTSGMVVSNDNRRPRNPSSTRGNTGWAYGRFEVRARFDSVPGMWPAIWLRSQNRPFGEWPRSGEIDFMEHPGSRPSDGGGRYGAGGRYINTDRWWYDGGPRHDAHKTYRSDPGWYQQWHTYAVDWAPGRIRYSIDGQVTRTVNHGHPFVAGNPMFLTFNLQVGGDWAGPPGVSSATYDIDWARVYQ